MSVHFPLPTRPDGTPTPHPIPQRRTEYAVSVPGGGWHMVDRLHVKPGEKLRATAEQIIAAVAAVGTTINPRYFVGTAYQEAGMVLNTWETELSGFVSVGVFQIGEEEADHYGHFKLIDMLDLAKAVSCIAGLAGAHRDVIRHVIKLPAEAPDPACLGAFLGVAHNHGMGFCRGWLNAYFVPGDAATLEKTWAKYKQIRPDDHIVDHHYGQSCIDGGPLWPKPAPASVSPTPDQNEAIRAAAALQQQFADFFSRFGH